MNIAFIVVIVAVAVIVVVARAFVVFDALLFRIDAACWLVLSSTVCMCVYVCLCISEWAKIAIVVIRAYYLPFHTPSFSSSSSYDGGGDGDGGVVVVLQIIHQLPSTVCALSK